MSAPGAFATKRVWVMRYSPQERHASGKSPNQHAGGDGPPKYMAPNPEIENQDIVPWYPSARRMSAGQKISRSSRSDMSDSA